MSDTLLVSTRKGLFTVSRQTGRWEIGASISSATTSPSR